MIDKLELDHNPIQQALGTAIHKAIEDVKEVFNCQVSYTDVVGVLEEIKWDFLLDSRGIDYASPD